VNLQRRRWLYRAFSNFSNADGTVNVNQFSQKSRINSVLGSLSLGFYNFIYLDASARNDWSSTLPAASNSYFYPALNVGVVLSEKVSIPGISYLKVRGGLAKAGKDTDPYRLAFVYGALTPWWRSVLYRPGSRPNNALLPEYS
jgi:hypothetical protein